jgi:RNA polymerase sigma-70 factor (ECF subfamily)
VTGPEVRVMSDGELVRQALAGRNPAFEELVRRWAGRVTALCHARTRHAAAAEDLAQETLLRAFRALKSLAEPEKFGPWLCGIATRTCLDWLKSKDRTQVPFSTLAKDHSPDDLLPCGQAAEPDMDREDEVRRLMAEVEALPDDCREVVMLYYYQDVTYRDLAVQLGVSAATINARLTRARNLLRERLSGSPR